MVIDEATRETGEPFGYKTVWFKFLAAGASTFTVSTYGSLAGDADSGDGTPGAGDFGYLDTTVTFYVVSLLDAESPTFGDLFFQANNDDHSPTAPNGSDGDYWSYLSQPVFSQAWYYVQVGTFDPAYTGTLQVSFTGVPETYPSNLVEVGDCPVMVEYRRTGTSSQTFYPQNDLDTPHSDGYVQWYEPAYSPGYLLVWIGYGDKSDVSPPAGYTVAFNGSWDEADITDPSPRGARADTHWPVNQEHVYLIVAYRVTTDTKTSTQANTPVGTITGIKYSFSGPPIQNAASGGDHNTCFGVTVIAFELLQMGGEYNQSFDWPATPVKAGTISSANYERHLQTGESYPYLMPVSVNVSDTEADHPGNHIYMTLEMFHGLIEGLVRTSTPRFRTTLDLLDQFSVSQFRVNSEPNGTIFEGDHHYNDCYLQAWLSNKDYFQPFIPESHSGVDFNGSDVDTWTAENGFTTSTPAPGHQLSGTTDSTGRNLWHDGGTGVEGTDWYTWALRGGLAALQVVIQGPETTRPSNDVLANAYPITDCDVQIVECIFGQTNDGDPILEHALDASVWFAFTPSVSQSGLVIDTWQGFLADEGFGLEQFQSEYDTVLAVYDSSMTLIAENDDILNPDSLRLSQVTLDVVGGQTYYIQVAGRGGDEGRLVLTINADCSVAYWGINASTPT